MPRKKAKPARRLRPNIIVRILSGPMKGEVTGYIESVEFTREAFSFPRFIVRGLVSRSDSGIRWPR